MYLPGDINGLTKKLHLLAAEFFACNTSQKRIGSCIGRVAIMKIITKMRTSRSRPCYQNILTHLNRGEYKDLQMDDLKSVLEGMIEKYTIQKNGEQNESFYVIEETNVLEHDENNESTKSLESFVNDEFLFSHNKQNQIGSKLGCR